jgi:hypothetical protein
MERPTMTERALLPAVTDQAPIPQFLESLYNLAARGEVDRAAERIADHLDDLLNDGKFLECNQLFPDIDERRLTAPLLVALLGVTRSARDQLPDRLGFSSRVRDRLISELGPERAERLLQTYILKMLAGEHASEPE